MAIKVGTSVWCRGITPMVSAYGSVARIDADGTALVNSDGGFRWLIPLTELISAEEREKTHPGERARHAPGA